MDDRELQPPQIFISYSHRDQRWLDRLQVHLAPLLQNGAIAAWADTRIRPRQEWETEIKSAIGCARAAVLLVTPDFLASDFIQENELPPLLEAAEAKGLVILWVAVSASLYDEARFAKYQAVNDPSQPLNSLPRPKREAEWVQIARKIKETVTVKSPVSKKGGLFLVPYERNPTFTGREEVLASLRAKLVSNSAAALSQTEAISGLGGIGKTQTALEYAYRYRENYSAVLWVTAETEQTLSTGFSAIAQRLQLPEKDNSEQDQVRKAVLRWLESQEQWLVVFDNADKPELLKAYWPRQHQGYVLLTSRAPVFESAGLFLQPIGLDKLNPEEARLFLLRRTGRTSLEEAEWGAADALAQELDYLPLALEQAAAYMVQRGTRFQDYLVSFRKRRLELLERQQPTMGHYARSVATTWALNFVEVEQTPASADLLRLSGFLAPEDIPLDLLARGLAQLDGPLAPALAGSEEDPLVLDEVLEPLLRYSLAQRHPEGLPAYSIHRLTQAVIQQNLGPEAEREWAERALVALSWVFPQPDDISAWPVCQRLISHVQICAEWVRKWGLQSERAALLLNEASLYLRERAQYAEAELLSRRALAIHEEMLGPDHPETANSLNNLAGLYRQQGRDVEAEELERGRRRSEEK